MKLSPRQTQVIERVVERGMSRPEIADDLGISVSTVRMHIDKIVERSGLPGRPNVVLNRIWYTMLDRTPQ